MQERKERIRRVSINLSLKRKRAIMIPINALNLEEIQSIGSRAAIPNNNVTPINSI